MEEQWGPQSGGNALLVSRKEEMYAFEAHLGHFVTGVKVVAEKAPGRLPPASQSLDKKIFRYAPDSEGSDSDAQRIEGLVYIPKYRGRRFPLFNIHIASNIVF